MVAILQMIFSDVFCLNDNILISIGSGNGLAPNKEQAVTWTYVDPVNWGIYTEIGRDELPSCLWP